MKRKAKLNKAEKFVLAFCVEHPLFTGPQLREAVAAKLGLNTDGFKYMDVEEPKLPPEYTRAIDTAVKVATQLDQERNS